MAWKHHNADLDKFLGRKNTSDMPLMPAEYASAARSALDEFHAGPGTPGSVAHFRMCLSGAGVPPAEGLLDKIVDAEVLKKEEQRSTRGSSPS